MIYEQIIVKAAQALGMSGKLLLAICMHESGLNNTFVPVDGTSPTYGICQIKYETASMLGYKGEPKGLMDPTTNAKWAATYLKYQKDRYDNNWCKAAAAYNAGSYLPSTLFPGYPKNLKYVRKVQSLVDESYKHKLSCNEEQLNAYNGP